MLEAGKMVAGTTPKRAVFFLLSVCILPGSGLARYSGGSGEPNDPYKIANVVDLLTLTADANDYNQYFILAADIDMSGYLCASAVIAPDTNNASPGFQGIAFTGVFDGRRHKIGNLNINTSGAGNDYLGLFGLINTQGVVKNLTVENVGVAGGNYSFYLGGITGENRGNISKCSSTGNVVAGNNSGLLGGLAGWNNGGTINNCFSTGTVAGGDSSGGLGGLSGTDSGNISNCFSTAAVTGAKESYDIGGLVGYKYSGAVSNCFSTGTVTGGLDSYLLGGLVGEAYEATISNCYFLLDAGPDNGLGTPLTDAQLKQQDSFDGWDFVWETVNGPNDIWAICEGVSYPKLAWQFIVGDSDNDRDVDLVDFAMMGLKWMQAESNLYCGGQDLTGDEFVDLDDMAALAGRWLEGTQ
jgi:hypothetical protein